MRVFMESVVASGLWWRFLLALVALVVLRLKPWRYLNARWSS